MQKRHKYTRILWTYRIFELNIEKGNFNALKGVDNPSHGKNMVKFPSPIKIKPFEGALAHKAAVNDDGGDDVCRLGSDHFELTFYSKMLYKIIA